MKLRIIALLISCCILLMSMSGCERNNLIYHTEDNPVSCTIDGIEYKSSPERVLNWGGSLMNSLNMIGDSSLSCDDMWILI